MSNSSTVFESELKLDISNCLKSMINYDHLNSVDNRCAFCSGYFQDKYDYISELLECILLNRVNDIPF